ncbi:hypothetical protein HK098_007245 [Nowakowskiella sp. JEL0407]|nr:hypothetical protein HK098_007245 [Nowakowskiella sp. JEL0407]
MQMNEDEILAQLLDLGFDYYLCKNAIRNCNPDSLSLESATNWILSHISVDANLTNTSNIPETNPTPPPTSFSENSNQNTTATQPPSTPLINIPTPERSTPIQSRPRDSKFDLQKLAVEKEIENSKRWKIPKKDIRKDILQQFKEDRERLRERKSASSSSSSAPPAKESTAWAIAPPPSNITETFISIRVPSGTVLKSKFPADSKLSAVFNFVKSSVTASDARFCKDKELIFASNFPRIELDEVVDGGKALSELRLVPSASFTLQTRKMQVNEPQAVSTPTEPMDMVVDAPIIPSSSIKNVVETHPQSSNPTEKETTLQIRLPTKTIRQKFTYSTRLSTIFDIISSHMTLEPTEFVVNQMFPRRSVRFEEDKEKSVEEVGFVPSASLFVVRNVVAGPDVVDPVPDRVDDENDTPAVSILPVHDGQQQESDDDDEDDDMDMDDLLEEEDMLPEEDLPIDDDMEMEDEGPDDLFDQNPVVQIPTPQTNYTLGGDGAVSGEISREERANLFVGLQTHGRMVEKSMKQVSSLRELCLINCAELVSNPKLPEKFFTPLRECGFSVADELVVKLQKIFKFDRFTINRMKICPITTINLDSYRLATDSLLQAIGLHFWNSLESLSLRNDSYVTDEGITYLKGLRHIHSLDLSSCGITDKAVNALTGLNTLTKLNLSLTKITTLGIRKLAHFLSESLTELLVAGCEGVNGNNVFVSLQELQHLETLSLANTKITSPQNPPNLRSFSVLSNLDVACTSMSDEDLLRIVTGFKELRKLNLSSCSSIGKRGLSSLSQSLNKLENVKFPSKDEENIMAIVYDFSRLPMPLTTLDLTGFKEFGYDGIECLPRFAVTLTTLSLCETMITDDGLKFVGECINISKLDLSRTAITDYGMIDHLSKLRNLTELSLSETGITNRTLTGLFPTSPFRLILKKLNLSRCKNINNDGVIGIACKY